MVMSEKYYVGQMLTDRPDSNVLNEQKFEEYSFVKRNRDTGEELMVYVIGNIMSEEDRILDHQNTKDRKRIRDWFKKNDYKHNKYLRGEYTEEEWKIVKQEFKSKAEELTECIAICDTLFEKYTGIVLSQHTY